MNGWITQFPKQGSYFHLHNLMSVGIVVQWLEENYRKTRVVAISISGEEMRKWRLTTNAKVKTFCAWMRNNSCTDRARIRVQYKIRHHRRP